MLSILDRSSAWRRYLAGWVLAAAWAVTYRRIVHGMYPSDAPGFAFDWSPAGLLVRYAAYLLSFLNTLVPNVDPEKAGWAMPPAVSALAVFDVVDPWLAYHLGFHPRTAEVLPALRIGGQP